MEDEYYDISMDWDETIFKKLEFHWYITQTDEMFYVDCYFPQIKLSMTYRDYFTKFDDALNYGNSKWGSFVYKEDLNEIE